jgi:hypothetical protein
MFNRVLAKASEGEQQQLLLLQVPASDNENDEMTNSQTTAYNASLDHQYLNEENQAVFLSSNAIPVTTCVTVTSDDQVLEVQIEQDPEEQEQELEQDQDMGQEEEEDKEVTELEEARITDEEQEDYANHENDNETKVDDETNEAVNNISGGESWNITNDGVIVVNQSNYKRKIMSIDMPKEEEEVMELEDT